MILQLNPPIPVFTPRGAGYCVAWIDYSMEHNTLWKVILDDGGEVWDFPQSEIRGVENFSMGRGLASFGPEVVKNASHLFKKCNDQLTDIDRQYAEQAAQK